MYLFSLHPPKAKDCFKPHFTTDKGNFGYYQQWCCCGGDLKGISCHGNCTRPGRSLQSLGSPSWHRFSALSTWVRSIKATVGVSVTTTGAAGEVELKKNCPKMKKLCFSSFSWEPGDCLQGHCEVYSKHKELTESPTPLQSSSNVLSKGAQMSWRAPGLEVFPTQTTPCQF